MAMLKERVKHHPDDYYLEILSQADNGGWILRLPPSLKAQQPELEMLIDKVFSGRPSCRENLALAQQMSVNWCASKCRQRGVSLDDCLAEAI
jgi:hypothetical protein